jgi:hypothetical protein
MADSSAKIVITAVDQTKAGIDSATKGIQSLSGAISSLPGFGGVAASLAAFAGLGAFKTLIGDTISAAAGMDDLSEKTGASVEKLSALAKVAKISGVEMSTVEGSLIRLSKALAGGDEESKGAGHALAAIGLEAAKLRELDPADQLKALADALSQYEDGTGKTAAALDILGKSGAEALPYLKDLADEQSLQGKLTKEQAAAAEQLEKAWNRVNAEGGGWAKSIAIDLIPTLASLMDFLNLTKMGIYQFGSSLAVVANDVITFAKVAAVAVGAGFTDEGQDKIKSLLDQRSNFNSAANEETAARLSKFSSLRDKIDATLSGGGAALPKLSYVSRAPKATKSAGGGGRAAGSKSAGTYKDYDATLIERITRAIEQTDIIKAAELASTLAKLDELAAAGLDPAIVKAVRDDLTGAAKTAADEVKRLNDFLADTPTAQIEKARDDMVFLAKALEDGKIKEEQYLEAVIARLGIQGEAVQKTLVDLDQFAIQAASNIQDAFADFLFDPFKDGTDGMLKSFGDAVRRMIANAVAADLGRRLFGDIGSNNGSLGGWVGKGLGIVSGLLGFGEVGPQGYAVPGSGAGAPVYGGDLIGGSFASGIDYVPHDMIAQIHKGERVVPAAENRSGGRPINITVNVSGASGNAAEVRRAAGQGAREALSAMAGARRYV